MFKFIHHNGVYRAKLMNLGQHNALQMTFDTGAIRTVISMQAIAPDCEISGDDLLVRIPPEKKRQTFYSATGNEITGFLAYADDVYLSGTKIDRFFYYFVVTPDRSIALLGDDFISRCKFHHDVDGNIEVDDFDSAGYVNEESFALSISELRTILGLQGKSVGSEI